MSTQLPPGPFSIVYADPPWRYARTAGRGCCESVYADGGDGRTTMTLDDLCAMPVQDIVTDDAWLWMWGTWPKLWEGADDNAFRLMDAWGFRYVTCGMLWVKTAGRGGFKFGNGFYTKANSEFCLLGVRGRPWANLHPKVDSISQILPASPPEIWAPGTGHSEKPDEARRMILRFCGDLPRVELFSRHARHGFVPWGNEAGRFGSQLEIAGIEGASA